MLISIGEVKVNSLIKSMKHMSANKNGITSEMVKNLEDKEIKKLFLRNGPHHQDGWGIAYEKDNNFKIKKSTNSILKDPKIFSLRDIKTNHILLHTRYKTIGSKSLKNTQPFQHENFIFSHNGTIKKKIKYDQQRFPNKPGTDSEALFYSILSKIDKISMPESIKTTFDSIEKEPNSNIFLSTKDKTYIYSSSRTLPDYYRMKIGKNKDFIVISSEIIPLKDVSWEDLPFGQVVEIQNKTRTITIYN
jgi:predicted glutamine amidotransferase